MGALGLVVCLGALQSAQDALSRLNSDSLYLEDLYRDLAKGPGGLTGWVIRMPRLFFRTCWFSSLAGP
jgi:hypothetical protein